MPEYKSREYCRDVKCNNQLEYDNGSISKNILKIYCQDCKAYKFHKWLQEHDYKIVKAKILEEHQEMDAEFEDISAMIENTPEDSSRVVLNELIDDIKDIADNNYGKWRNVNE